MGYVNASKQLVLGIVDPLLLGHIGIIAQGEGYDVTACDGPWNLVKRIRKFGMDTDEVNVSCSTDDLFVVMDATYPLETGDDVSVMIGVYRAFTNRGISLDHLLIMFSDDYVYETLREPLTDKGMVVKNKPCSIIDFLDYS